MRFGRADASRTALQYYRYGQQDFAQNKESKKQKLTMPVLAIGGEHSLGKYVEMLMQEFASNIRGSVIKDCGHWIAEEQSEELNVLKIAPKLGISFVVSAFLVLVNQCSNELPN
jgi:pimeloyl-ACP methyl ester carboxylesterase